MTASEIANIAALVMALTQIVKRMVPRDDLGPYINAVTTTIVVLVWVGSGAEWPPSRVDLYSLLGGWVAVYTAASGLYVVGSMTTDTVKLQAERLRKTRVRKVLDAQADAAVPRA